MSLRNMALEPQEFSKILNEIRGVAEHAPIKDENRDYIMNMVLGEAFGEMEDMIDESRPPRLYVFGRSGAGKSSLINALANRDVADVGGIKPTTVESTKHHIPFPDRYASWDVIDSRGLFETVTPDGEVPEDTLSIIKNDLENYRPDILIHVMTPDQVRAGEEDFEAVNQLREEFSGLFPPVLYCLNKVDLHMSLNDPWPPEENPTLAGNITRNLDFVHEVVEQLEKTEMEKSPFKENQPLYGYEFGSDHHIGVVPTHLKEKENYWNIYALSWLISDFLPDDARMQFMQAQQRERLMREMSRNLTERVSGFAGGVGGAPVPVADIAVLSSLQLALVAVIGGFSCRDIGWDLVQDYLGAMGPTVAAGFGARELARLLIQVVPAGGTAISAAVAYATTYGVGRSAEEYFFNDRVIKPGDFVQEAKPRYSS